MTFQLDTSGTVAGYALTPADVCNTPSTIRWLDLDPFTQGYVEALFAGVWGATSINPHTRKCTQQPLRFSDLAPETLAAILKDCAEVQATMANLEPKVTNNRQRGMQFWAGRQFGFHMRWSLHQMEMVRRFPPLTPYLGDDGKVHLKERGQ